MGQILEGLLYINDVDVFTTYGAFLCEDQDKDNTNYAELMKPATMKPYVSVDFREQDGEKLPDELIPRFEPRDITLQFAIVAVDKADFLTKYSAFVTMLRAGWISLNLPELDKTFRMYYVNCSQWDQITPFDDGDVVAKFKIKFREPIPAV